MQGSMSQMRCPDPSAFERAQYMRGREEPAACDAEGIESKALTTERTEEHGGNARPSMSSKVRSSTYLLILPFPLARRSKLFLSVHASPAFFCATVADGLVVVIAIVEVVGRRSVPRRARCRTWR